MEFWNWNVLHEFWNWNVLHEIYLQWRHNFFSSVLTESIAVIKLLFLVWITSYVLIFNSTHHFTIQSFSILKPFRKPSCAAFYLIFQNYVIASNTVISVFLLFAQSCMNMLVEIPVGPLVAEISCEMTATAAQFINRWMILHEHLHILLKKKKDLIMKMV